MLLNEKEKPIGVQIIGPHAGDILAEWVAVLNGGVKLATLAGAVHPCPTLAEINKRVADTYFSGKIFSDTVKKGPKLFFSLKGGTGKNPCTKISPEISTPFPPTKQSLANIISDNSHGTGTSQNVLTLKGDQH